MKKSSTNGPNRNIRYSAADKLKAVKLFIEDGYPFILSNLAQWQQTKNQSLSQSEGPEARESLPKV